MIYTELVLHLQDPSKVSKGSCEECYTFMEPVLTALRCRKISVRKQDARVVAVFNGPFRKLWAIEHQHPQEYWDRLKLMGNTKEYSEFAMLKQRKLELKAEWKRLFATSKKNKGTTGSEDTAGSN